MSATPTPRPWAQQKLWPVHIVPADHAGRPFGFAEDEDHDRATYALQIMEARQGRFITRDEARANARLVVHCVNLHDELIVALKEMTERFTRCATRYGSAPEFVAHATAAARAVLARADASQERG